MPPVPANRRKKIIIIDAVTWTIHHPADHPLRDVGGWFSRHFITVPNLDLQFIASESDVLSALREGTDGVIISGSPRDAWADDSINARLCEVVLDCKTHKTPLLGVCYGHQIIGRALGGQVARHPQGWEVGNILVDLTDAGRKSSLFDGVPSRMEVISSHADAVLTLPPGCELLVSGAFTTIQGISYADHLFGVQFHPEMDPAILQFLWSSRKERWRKEVSFDLYHALDTLRPTPNGGVILRNFVEKIVP